MSKFVVVFIGGGVDMDTVSRTRRVPALVGALEILALVELSASLFLVETLLVNHQLANEAEIWINLGPALFDQIEGIL